MIHVGPIQSVAFSGAPRGFSGTWGQAGAACLSAAAATAGLAVATYGIANVAACLLAGGAVYLKGDGSGGGGGIDYMALKGEYTSQEDAERAVREWLAAQKKKLPVWAWVLIGLGGVTLVGGGIYLAMR